MLRNNHKALFGPVEIGIAVAVALVFGLVIFRISSSSSVADVADEVDSYDSCVKAGFAPLDGVCVTDDGRQFEELETIENSEVDSEAEQDESTEESNTQQSATVPSSNPADVSSDETAKQTVFEEVKLSNGEIYYGQADNISVNYLRLSRIFYANDSNGQTQINKTGEEIHGPEDFMFVNRSKITAQSKLAEDNVVVRAIKNYGMDIFKRTAAPTSSNISSFVKSAQHQGVFIAGDEFFGDTQSLNSSQASFAGDSAYSLNTPSGGGLNLEQVDRPPISTASILYWVNLKPDSHVSEAINSYESS